MRTIIVLSLAVLSLPAWADLPIVYVNMGRVGYDLSPSNDDNSPDNYDNSLSNYVNSNANYDNSAANYSNSPVNLDNGMSGWHRLVYRPDSLHTSWAGYYVARDGYLNFFSTGGKRMFYKPGEHGAVFSADDGSFCGAVAEVGGELSLALTAHGIRVFAKLNKQ